MKLPQPVNDYLIDWLERRYDYGYFRLDLKGHIQSWGGNLKSLGLQSISEGQSISEKLIFMEGLLPINEPVLHLPMIKPDSKHVWDVHLFRIEEGYGLLILDAHTQAQEQRVFQQKINEQALKDQKKTDIHEYVSPPPSGLFEELFFACNIAVLEMDNHGQFAIIGRAPEWLSRFCPDLLSRPCQLDSHNALSFLDNFLHEAHLFWSSEKSGAIKSGVWIETEETDIEHLFEAMAVRTGHRKILLITKEHGTIKEKRNLIQKGREIALGHSNLKKAQNALKAVRDDLEARVRERTQELEQMNLRMTEELEYRKQLEAERTEMMLHLQQAQKMEAIGTLAGGIAHDFNNILSAVLGFTELSLMEAPKDSQLRSNLQHVVAAGQRAKKLIRQILTFSRQSNPETLPVQLSLIMKEAIELLRASLPATIEIKHQIESNAFVMADPSQLHQVVMNLCTNASQAMHSDGGILELSLRDCDFRPENTPAHLNVMIGSYVEMSVKDTGHGMPHETLSRIFDPFFTTKEKGEGTGMGLSVVHGIVKNCKGDISVKSKIGEGTIFQVLLPTIKQTGPTENTITTMLPRGNERILFVDDEPVQVDLAIKFLAPLGYQVKTFTDSTAALQNFYDQPDGFDMVLTDLNMPKMTGRVLSKKIAKIRSDIPIVLCSGYSDSPAESAGSDPHISGYLMKPFAMAELATTIRQILDKRSKV